MRAILEVRDLVKHFPGVQAVNGVSFAIRPGICFGLLGPNGAGKTTTIEVIEGIREPDSGEILYQGEPRGQVFRQECGIQFQSTALPDYLSVTEAIALFASFYPRTLPLAELAERCEIGDLLARDVHKLSGGQRQRVLLAIALISDPEIIFLDEPTTGLDPQARRSFWDLVVRIRKSGKTIVLTTHYMDEAQVLCDEIAIMDKGRVVMQGTPSTLLRSVFDTVKIQIPLSAFTLKESAGFTWPRTEVGEDVEIETTDVNRCIRELLEQGISLKHLRTREPKLEDLFLRLTGREQRP